MNFSKSSILFLLLSLTCLDLYAQENEKKSPLRFLLGGALEFGGDEVAEVYFTNGESQSVNAGQGISIAIGGQLQFPSAEKLLLRGSLGYKYVTTQAENVHIRLTRVPINLTANVLATDKLRFGAGISMHRNIKFKADGLGPDISFTGANGPIFEIAYGAIGISYTSMRYKDSSNLSYSANAFGITFSGVFPK